MTTARQYDYLNRLQSVASDPGGTRSLSSLICNYTYNAANQRTRRTEVDSGYWVYQYDRLGQVTSSRKYWADGSPAPGQQFEYGCDDIGNRTWTKAGGDANGASLRSATYTANLLNQYTSRTVPGGFDVIGLAYAGSSVTVNSSSADFRRGEYFQELVSVNNANSTPVWQSVSVTTSGGGSVLGNVWVSGTPESLGYDLDGNLTGDGRWTYTWDGENRLKEMMARTATGLQQLLRFESDGQGRRIRKQVWNNIQGSGDPAVDLRFLYEGWNLLAEVGTGGAMVRSYVWGLDLSGSEQGAGGVGCSKSPAIRRARATTSWPTMGTET